MSSIINKLLSPISKVEWHVAYREKVCNDVDFTKNLGRFIPIKNSKRYWYADPFLIDYSERTLLFVEMYDRLKRKGLLGYMDITEGVGSKFKKVYEYNCHLSYPNVFVKGNDLYCIPESSNSKKLLLLKWNKQRCEFDESKVLLDDMKIADSTFIHYNDKLYCLTTPIIDGDNISNLNLYEIVEGNFVPSSQNPVCDNKTKARCGGKIQYSNDTLYRISQDCGNGYGSGLNIMRIDNLDNDAYKETLVKKILPNDIQIKGVDIVDGIHTYNTTDMYEVIDYKTNRSFSIIECVGYLLGKCGLIKQERK